MNRWVSHPAPQSRDAAACTAHVMSCAYPCNVPGVHIIWYPLHSMPDSTTGESSGASCTDLARERACGCGFVSCEAGSL